MKTFKRFQVGSLIEWCDAHGSEVLEGLSDEVGSWRGDYTEVAIEPGAGITASALAETLRARIGTKMAGFKGGEYSFERWCDVHVAAYGEEGGALGVSDDGELAVMLW